MPGGAATTGGFSYLLSKDYEEVMYDEYARQSEEYSAVAKMATMTTNYIKKGEMAGLGALQEMSEGQAIPFEQPEQGNQKTVYSKNFGLGFQVTRNMFDDDLTGHMKEVAGQLGKSLAYTRELEYWDIINNCTNTTYRAAIDAVALASSSHTTIDGTATVDNLGTAGTLSETTIQEALNAFETLVNERNIPIVMKPRLLIIPPALKWKAKELLMSEFRPYTADNEINSLQGEDLQYMVCHYLTSTTGYSFVADGHDLQFIWRKQPEFQSQDDFNTGNAMFKVVARLTTDFWNYRGFYHNAGA